MRGTITQNHRGPMFRRLDASKARYYPIAKHQCGNVGLLLDTFLCVVEATVGKTELWQYQPQLDLGTIGSS